MSARTAVIADLDGTLVDVRGTLHLLTAADGTKDFEAFHVETNRIAPPTPWVMNWCEAQISAGHEVVLLTGRPERFREGTHAWLGRHVRFPYLGPAMRPTGDFRHDHAIKREVFTLLGEAGLEIVGAIDDRPQVLALWRELGLDPVVVHRPDWTAAGEPYSEADLAAWEAQGALRSVHGYLDDGSLV